jgi:2-oxoglutarate dehydrogenase E1 component
MDPLDKLLALDPDYLDDLYRSYLRDPGSVHASWAELFRRYERGEAWREQPLADVRPIPPGVGKISRAPGIQIYDLVHTYRQFGHLIADIDPLGQSPREHPFLNLEQFGFSEEDLNAVVRCEGYHGLEEGTVGQHLEILRETYCGPIGVEFMDVVDPAERDWLQERMEPIRNRPQASDDQRRTILNDVLAADSFEQNLHRMYPGAKRFSLEGGTTLITLLKTLVYEAPEAGAEHLVFGMAHRGRLNVLAHVLEKPLAYILAEFEGRPLSAEVQGYGDVKYHLGYSSDLSYGSGNGLHLSLTFNPSHLETVNPVVEGIVRAKQTYLGDTERKRVIPVLMHGDAAFTGQGVVSETFTLADIKGYRTGGTIHVIVNNQVGFTADPDELRSTRYSSDIAKIVRVPVFHVNADHPEAVMLCAQLALAYRQRFHRDVVIDLLCFRRHGHNELDDASYTQPVMSRLIREHRPVSEIYADKLIQRGVVTREDVSARLEELKRELQAARETAKGMPEQVSQVFGGRWQGLGPAGDDWSATTAARRDDLERIARALRGAPEGFHWHPRLEKQMNERAQMVLEDQPLDWGCGEALAYGSLLLEGTPVRLSGQDSGRGTFSHRHAIYADMETGAHHVPLNHIAPDQARFEILNSPLSEEAVLGFEYGYSTADPWTLVVWEAQFGDFVNGAQVIIDQLIASAEYKWGRMSGLVMLLPHGYEGQGPEHSSARLERFLELCAENNLQVCNLTTPAQLFHALRRQIHRRFRKPLVIMSPKSLLRHRQAVSTVAELCEGTFQTVLDDPHVVEREKVERVLFCSGKIYYALDEERRKRELDDVAIVRLEQLYPYPVRAVEAVFSRYPAMSRLIWVQEEPRNMGAYRNLVHRFQASTPPSADLEYVGRDSRAVPATGSINVHQREERELIEAAFREPESPTIVRRMPGLAHDAEVIRIRRA